MPTLRSTLVRCAALSLLVLAAAGCDLFNRDGDGTTQGTLGNFNFDALGGAQIIEADGKLIVTNIGSSGEDGVSTSVTIAGEADFFLEPVVLPDASSQFVQRYFGDGSELARIIHQGLGTGNETISVEFPGLTGVVCVRMVYYFQGQVVFVRDVPLPPATSCDGAPLSGAEAGASAEAGLITGAISGSGSSGSGSVHVVRVGNRTVVGTDFGGADTQALTGVPFTIPGSPPGAPEEIDFIEFIPLEPPVILGAELVDDPPGCDSDDDGSGNGYVQFCVDEVRMTAADINGFVLTSAEDQASQDNPYGEFDRAIQGAFVAPSNEELTASVTGSDYLVVEDLQLTTYEFLDFGEGSCYVEQTYPFVNRLNADRYEVEVPFFYGEGAVAQASGPSASLGEEYTEIWRLEPEGNGLYVETFYTTYAAPSTDRLYPQNGTYERIMSLPELTICEDS